MSPFENCVHKEVLKEEKQQRRIHWSVTPQEEVEGRGERGEGRGERGGRKTNT